MGDSVDQDTRLLGERNRAEEAFEEGQGPHRAVQSMIMMNVNYYRLACSCRKICAAPNEEALM
jgi:hypothetical protein